MVVWDSCYQQYLSCRVSAVTFEHMHFGQTMTLSPKHQCTWRFIRGSLEHIFFFRLIHNCSLLRCSTRTSLVRLLEWWLDHCCGHRLHSAPAIEERIWYWMPMDWRFTRLCCTLWLGENPCQSISCKNPLCMVPCCCYWFEIIWKSMWNITWMKYTYI